MNLGPLSHCIGIGFLGSYETYIQSGAWVGTWNAKLYTKVYALHKAFLGNAKSKYFDTGKM